MKSANWVAEMGSFDNDGPYAEHHLTTGLRDA